MACTQESTEKNTMSGARFFFAAFAALLHGFICRAEHMDVKVRGRDAFATRCYAREIQSETSLVDVDEPLRLIETQLGAIVKINVVETAVVLILDDAA